MLKNRLACLSKPSHKIKHFFLEDNQSIFQDYKGGTENPFKDSQVHSISCRENDRRVKSIYKDLVTCSLSMVKTFFQQQVQFFPR